MGTRGAGTGAEEKCDHRDSQDQSRPSSRLTRVRASTDLSQTGLMDPSSSQQQSLSASRPSAQLSSSVKSDQGLHPNSAVRAPAGAHQQRRSQHRRNKSSDLTIEMLRANDAHVEEQATVSGALDGGHRLAYSMRDLSTAAQRSPPLTRRRSSGVREAKSLLELSKSVDGISRLLHEPGLSAPPPPALRRRRSSLKPLQDGVLYVDTGDDQPMDPSLINASISEQFSKYDPLPDVPNDSSTSRRSSQVPEALQIDSRLVLGPIGTSDHKVPEWVEEQRRDLSVSPSHTTTSTATTATAYSIRPRNVSDPIGSSPRHRSTSPRYRTRTHDGSGQDAWTGASTGTFSHRAQATAQSGCRTGGEADLDLGSDLHDSARCIDSSDDDDDDHGDDACDLAARGGSLSGQSPGTRSFNSQPQQQQQQRLRRPRPESSYRGARSPRAGRRAPHVRVESFESSDSNDDSEQCSVRAGTHGAGGIDVRSEPHIGHSSGDEGGHGSEWRQRLRRPRRRVIDTRTEVPHPAKVVRDHSTNGSDNGYAGDLGDADDDGEDEGDEEDDDMSSNDVDAAMAALQLPANKSRPRAPSSPLGSGARASSRGSPHARANLSSPLAPTSLPMSRHSTSGSPRGIMTPSPPAFTTQHESEQQRRHPHRRSHQPPRSTSSSKSHSSNNSSPRPLPGTRPDASTEESAGKVLRQEHSAAVEDGHEPETLAAVGRTRSLLGLTVPAPPMGQQPRFRRRSHQFPMPMHQPHHSHDHHSQQQQQQQQEGSGTGSG